MPRIADRVAETTTTTGPGSLTLLGAAARRLAFGATFGSDPFYYAIEHQSATEWEFGVGVISGGLLVRTPVASSNSGAAVNLSAGTKDVRCVAPALLLNGGSVDKAFSTTISFRGRETMATQLVTGALAFVVDSAGAYNGAQVDVDLIADGVNVPTFTGFRRWGPSGDYANVLNVRNCLTFFWRGGYAWYIISQEYGTPVEPVPATAINYTAPTTSVVGTPSTNFTAIANGILSSSRVVTPSDGGGGGSFTPSSVTLPAGAPVAQNFTYTAGSTGVKTISFANDGGLTNNPVSVSLTASASATVPGAPTIGTATAGNAQATVAFTPPASNGGSAIIDYTVTSSPGGLTATGSASPLTVTGLTNGTAYTFTATARNVIGTGAASAASNSVTPSNSAQPMRFTSLTSITESGDGTAGWNYTGGSTYTVMKSVSALKLAAGTDGYVQLKIGHVPSGSTKQIWLGCGTNSAAQLYNGSGVFELINCGSDYRYIVSPSGFNTYGAPYTNLTCSQNDLIRLRRAGSTLYHEISNNNGSTWTAYRTVAVTTGDLYFYLTGDGAFVASDVRQLGLV